MRWLFGVPQLERNIPLFGRSAMQHELFHAIQDFKLGIFAREASMRLWQKIPIEFAAHCVWGAIDWNPARLHSIGGSDRRDRLRRLGRLLGDLGLHQCYATAIATVVGDKMSFLDGCISLVCGILIFCLLMLLNEFLVIIPLWMILEGGPNLAAVVKVLLVGSAFVLALGEIILFEYLRGRRRKRECDRVFVRGFCALRASFR
jgi:hypothetical protein